MLDHELRALVSVEPSPDFQARVRIKIAAKPRHESWLRLSFAALPISAAVVAALVVAFWPTTGPNDTEADAMRPLVEATGYSAPLPSFALPVPAQQPGIPPAPAVAAAVAPAVAGRSETPIAFDRAETLALQRLFGSALAPAVIDVAPPSDAPIVFPDIVIPPLVIDAAKEGASR